MMHITKSVLPRALLIAVMSAVALNPDAGELPAASDDRFCAAAQTLIAQTSVPVENVLHEDYQAFVESKATASPLVTQQFYSNPQPDSDGVNSVVSCKMKTGGSIVDARVGTSGEPVVAGEDRSCDFLTRGILSSVMHSIPAAQLAVEAAAIVVDEEQLTFMGPFWLDPWPFQSVYRDEEGLVHLKSRALWVPWSVLIPAPAAFKGVYYCHLVAPLYLQALLRGEMEVPVQAEGG